MPSPPSSYPLTATNSSLPPHLPTPPNPLSSYTSQSAEQTPDSPYTKGYTQGYNHPHNHPLTHSSYSHSSYTPQPSLYTPAPVRVPTPLPPHSDRAHPHATHSHVTYLNTFTEQSQLSTMSIQLNREKQRSKELYDELNALRNTAHTSSDKAGLTTSTLTRANHELTTEVNHLAAKVLDLELHLNSARKASDQTREDFRRVKLVFEGRLEECQKTTSQTITSAETSLTHYNDEWAKKLEQERILWVKKMRAQEEMTEHNLMSVQTQFSDAHDFYADHIKKVNKEKQREEERRRAVMDELEATREELVREKAARKALTSQLKKERKWREKCLNLTQQTMELRSENEEGKEEPTLPEKSRLQVDTPHPAQAPHTPLDPASKAYLQVSRLRDGEPPTQAAKTIKYSYWCRRETTGSCSFV